MNILWSFSNNSCVKFYSQNFGSPNMTVLYPNLYHNDICCKEIVLYVCFIYSSVISQDGEKEILCW